LQFFYGVDWASIRDIDAPFVPHLKSITDTSYFPTDEIDQTNDLPVGAEDGDDAKKDLAFLGYTYVSLVFPFFPFLLDPSSLLPSPLVHPCSPPSTTPFRSGPEEGGNLGIQRTALIFRFRRYEML
jgi:hypothetical protein